MKTTEGINSCLMSAVNLIMPVDLGSIFDSEDVTELELDSHATIIYAKNKTIEKNELIKDIGLILEPDQFNLLIDYEREYDVFDVCDLSLFENDEDILVLKLKDSECKKYLTLLNKALSTKYEITSDFSSYTPHITLATLKKGEGKKYLRNDIVKRVLEDSRIAFEDLMVSYGKEGEPDKTQYFLTNKNCVDRYFRLYNLRQRNKELEE